MPHLQGRSDIFKTLFRNQRSNMDVSRKTFKLSNAKRKENQERL
jgi:hypothetical protein